MKDVEVGDFYYKAGNYKAALSRFREALQYKPRDAVATFKLAQTLEKSKQFEEARAAVRGVSCDSQGRAERGRGKKGSGAAEEAITGGVRWTAWLDRLRREIEETTQGLGVADWSRAPQGRWNTAQILEHLGHSYGARQRCWS